MSKQIKDWWEKTSKDYQDYCKIPIDIHYGPGSPNEKELKLLGNLKNKKVLEIGCGGAQCGIAMAKKGAVVTGLDISKEQLEFAKNLAEKNKVKLTLIQGDAQTLKKIKTASFDVVFSAFMLQYMPDLKKCFKEVKRVLRKEGIFVFSLDHPFFEVIDGVEMKLRRSYNKPGKYTADNGFIAYQRNFSEIYNALFEAGFVVEKIIEPDSRKKYSYDPWYNKWNWYTPKKMKLVPPTIIFKAKK